MKKALDYLYIFSKLSTSFILLFILLIFGYFFYVSFKNQETSNNEQLDLINKLNQNVENLSKLSKKIELTESSLNQLKNSIQNTAKPDQSKEVLSLNKKIEELDLGLKNILVELQEIKITNNQEKIEKEFGDVLFSMINYARFIGVDPESALERTNKKFIGRFNYLEKEVKTKSEEFVVFLLNLYF